MKVFKIVSLFSLVLFLFSCGTLKEGFRNQKKNNSDEFLVEKKSPLVMPPEYNQLPTPDSDQEQKLGEDNTIKTLLSADKNENNPKDQNNYGKNLEESLLEKIKSN